MNPLIVAMIRHSGRSWWQARYSDGKVLSEWDTLTDWPRLPLGITGFNFGKSSRWEEVPKKGMVGLRLLCPNGMAGELEAPEGCRFIQLKHGGVMVAIGGGVGERYTDAHIIGVISGPDGNCLCRAWEAFERFTSPEFEKAETAEMFLVTPEDKAKAKAVLDRFHKQGYGKWKWRLTEFEDNVYDMKYRQIGPLYLDRQGVKM